MGRGGEARTAWRQALPVYQQALEHYRRLPGTEHRQAGCLRRIGDALRTEARHEEALAAFQNALA
ncbi:MAG: tetratricopeptide repeat protein, partial [Peptidiphaga sp.]